MKRLIPMAAAILMLALAGCGGGDSNPPSPYDPYPPPPVGGLPDPEQSREGIVATLSEEELKNSIAGEDAGRNELSHRERAVRQTRDEIGYREQGGANCNKFTDYFYSNRRCQAWCADFVSWAFDTTGNKDRKVLWGNPSYVGAINDWARANGKLADRPARGDIFTYRNNGHTGLVTKVEGDTFSTVEGNTTGKDGAVRWVWGHKRRVDGPYYFVRVDG